MSPMRMPARYIPHGGARISSKADEDGEDRVALGEGMLEHYFEWAPLVDRFSPLQVATEHRAAIADPRSPEADLLTAEGDAVRYRGRIPRLGGLFGLNPNQLRVREYDKRRP
jgi:hypothetical protein